MEQKGRYVNIKTKEGKFILSLYFNPGSGVVLEDRLGPEPRRERGLPKGTAGTEAAMEKGTEASGMTATA